MSFPADVKEKALVSCGRHCSLCHKFCGLKIELHHIVQKSEGGKDIFENCIPLCFDCHGDMRSYDHKHPKGTKYTTSELTRHRDLWYTKVQNSPAPSYNSNSASLDVNVYIWVKSILPWDGSVNFARINNFAGFSFPENKLDDFYNFLEKCEDPTHEFIDSVLEGFRSSLISDICEFVELIGNNTWPTERNPSRQTVPQEWEFEQPERFAEIVGKLHGLGKRIAATYVSLVRESRVRLGVE